MQPSLKVTSKKDSEKEIVKERVTRVMGLVLIIAGGILGKIFIWDVLEGIKSGSVDEVSYSRKIIALIGMLPVFGILLVILGSRFEKLFKMDNQKLKLKNILLLVLVVAPAFLVVFWFESELRRLGLTR